MRASKKFVFLVHDPVMLAHYADVWQAMGPSSFIIVLTEYFSGSMQIGVGE